MPRAFLWPCLSPSLAAPRLIHRVSGTLTSFWRNWIVFSARQRLHVEIVGYCELHREEIVDGTYSF